MSNTSRRGFASMDPDKQRQIASKGGKAAHAKGTAHEFTPEEAREAGRRGGMVVSQNREHMATIGREGGKKKPNPSAHRKNPPKRTAGAGRPARARVVLDPGRQLP